nr:hypothetical protein [uncultured Sphingosinicella sp.]
MRTFIASGLTAALALSLAAPAAALADVRAEAKTEAAAATDQGGASANTSAAVQERKVCKVLEMTGQRTKNKRVCMTSAEWRKVEDDQ